MRANDAISGLVLIVLALAMMALTMQFSGIPRQKYGPALFPRILGDRRDHLRRIHHLEWPARAARRRAMGRNRAMGL